MKIRTLYYMFIFFNTLVCQANDVLALLENNKPVYDIIIPENASYVEINAAKQLSKHLVHGSKKFNVFDENNVQAQKHIYIGNTRSYIENYGNLDDFLGRDGIQISFINNDVYINGNGERALLYAVYEFLEKFLKINFWIPGVYDYSKTNKNFNLSIKNIFYTPPFYYRSDYSYNAMVNEEFAAILKENGDVQPTNEHWGVVNKILGWVHTFNSIIPYEEYGPSHPEWFLDPSTNMPMKHYIVNLWGQKTQLDLNNKSMKEQFQINVLKWIKDNPDHEMISISQNDNKLFSRHDNYNSSDLLIHFLNDVAKEINIKYPKLKVETLAYHNTEKPPIVATVSKNIIIRLAQITSNLGYPLNHERNINPYKRFVGWADNSGELFYWMYNSNFKYPSLPFPGFYRINKDLELMRMHEVKGVFNNDNEFPNEYGYFQDMKTWVLAKLLWDPTLNQEELIEEFFNGFYKESSQPLHDYYKLVEREYLLSKKVFAAFQEDYSFLDKDSFFREAELLFHNAEKLAKSVELKERVKNEKKSFEFLKAYLKKTNSEDMELFFRSFNNNNYGNDKLNRKLKLYLKNFESKIRSYHHSLN